ncbi:MAG: glycosyltransferase family 4 protein [Burkholderiaceae bacterium]
MNSHGQDNGHSQQARPRVLLVSTNADLAGAPIHVRDLALQLQRSAPRLSLHVVFGEAGPIEQALRQAGIGTEIVPQIRSQISPLRDIAAIRALLRIVRRERIDLLHAHSSKAGFVARIAGALLGKPVIFTVHGWGFGAGRQALQGRIITGMEKAVMRFTARFLIVSRADAAAGEATLGLKAGQYQVVENGVPDVPLRAAPGTADAFLMVARVSHAKHHEMALRAFAGLPGDTRLLLAGGQTDDSAFRGQVREWAGGAAERVELLGARSDIPALLARAGVFVLCSRFEGMPLSIIEAMRAGLPVIATAVGGVPEVVVDEQTGLLVPPGDTAALSAAMARLASDPALRERLGQAGRARYEQRFSLAGMCDKVLSAYAEVLQRPDLADAATAS